MRLHWTAGQTHQICIARRSEMRHLKEQKETPVCLFCLPKYASSMGEGTYFCYCWNYKIWEAGGRCQCHSAEMTGRLEKMGRHGRIFFGSGMLIQFWLPQEPGLCFKTLCLSFFFLLLPLFLSLKYYLNWFSLSSCSSTCFQLQWLPSTLSCPRWQQRNWLSVLWAFWETAGGDVIELKWLLCISWKKMVRRTEASSKLAVISGLRFRPHWIEIC